MYTAFIYILLGIGQSGVFALEMRECAHACLEFSVNLILAENKLNEHIHRRKNGRERV